MAKEKSYAYGEADKTPTPPESKYQKVDEHVKDSFPEAEALANEIYSKFSAEKASNGSRTTDEAKVRIRARSDGSFRVVLYRKIGKPKKEEQDPKEKPDKKPKLKGKGKPKRGRQSKKTRTSAKSG